MPLFDFRCQACEASHELLLKAGEQPPCPTCGRNELVKLLSPFASPTGRSGASGPQETSSTPTVLAKPDGGHVHTASCKHGYVDSVLKKYVS